MDKLLFKKLHPDAQLPTRQSEHAAGYDLHSVDSLPIQTTTPWNAAVVSTGIAVAIPVGYYGRIAPRSGLAVKNRINVHAGVIDSDYRGEVKVALINHGWQDIQIKSGDRIAQLIIEKIATPEPEWAAELPETVRGDGGFGSSGQ